MLLTDGTIASTRTQVRTRIRYFPSSERAEWREKHPSEPIHVRIGLHTGEAIKEGGDFYGKTVILASRIAAEANGAEILVSSTLKDMIDSAGDLRFEQSREVELQGLAGVHRIHKVKW